MLRGSGLSRGQAAGVVHPGLQSGAQVLSLPMFGIGVTTSAMTADTKYSHPVFVPQACTCTGIQVVVGAAVAAVLGNLALYRAGATGRSIGSLLATGTAEVDMNSVANTVLQADFAAGVALSPGWYYPVAKFNGAAQPISVPVTAPGLISASYWLGAPALTSWVRNGTGGNTRMTSAEAYASAFSTDFGAVTIGNLNPGSPLLGLVVTV